MDELVQLAQSGVREAFGELVRRHRSQMYGYARSITHESCMAEDIVQEALIRAFLHLRKLWILNVSCRGCTGLYGTKPSPS